ncbi:MAG: LD-carboxypeptidase [Armatimonadetes bacterium]|nr:LD-carboxypeptidase [Armatimonadota bacterium]
MSANALWPPPLPPGGTVGVIAPAGPLRSEQLARGVRALRERGYRVLLGRHLRHKNHYLSGTDAERLEDLHAMWADPRVDAVWCARGGYGTMRLLPGVDWELIRRRPLPLIGYSDITALQLAMLSRAGLVTFSGPMVASGHGFGRAGGIDSETEAGVTQWVGNGTDGELRNPGGGLVTLQPGRCAGPLVGGNLTLTAALAGTAYAPDFTGAILFIEDVSETPLRVDRYLTALKLHGILDQVAGVILGDFSDCFPPVCEEVGPPVEELVLERLGRPDVPAVSGLAYGHIGRRCTVPVGARAEMDASAGRILVRRGQPAA